MKALVIGGQGLVGGALLRAARAGDGDALGTFHSRPSTGMVAVDITDPSSVEAAMASYRPGVVFLTAALTAVDYCEDHPDEAWRTNVEGARTVARAAAGAGAKTVFYSTEYVFDGRAGPYGEDDPPCPLGVYARSKAAAEEAIRQTCPDHLILRTTVVFGWEVSSLNFAMQLWQRLSCGERMQVPRDQVSNPTLVDFLAESSVRLVERDVRGVVNVVGHDRVPRTDFAFRLARRLALDVTLIEPVTTAELRQRAPRPLDAGLRTDRLAEIMGEPAIGLDDAIDQFGLAKEGAARGST